MATTTLRTGKLSARRKAAVKRRAAALGLTEAEYLQQLIEEDLSISAKARSTSLKELAAPFRKALGGLSEQELDRRVKAALAGRRNGSSVHRR